MPYHQTLPPNPLKIKLDRNSVPVIVWNLFPVFGVLAFGWKPESVFICYALETIILGVFNVFKLLAVYKYGLPPKPDETGVSGLFIIPFFIVHYYFFVFVQLTMFFSGRAGTGGMFGWVKEMPHYLNVDSFNASLGVFVLTNTLSFFHDFLMTGKHTTRTMGEQMFEPYPRIFVQQFVVILGGFFFSVTGNAYPVLIVFVAIKMYADLLLKDFDLRTWVEAQNAKAEKG